jgi:hypothetical protein
VVPNCYFSRSKDDSGSLTSILQNDNSQGATRITVKKGEFLNVSGCDFTKARPRTKNAPASSGCRGVVVFAVGRGRRSRLAFHEIRRPLRVVRRGGPAGAADGTAAGGEDPVLERDRELLARVARVNGRVGKVVLELIQHQDGGELPAAGVNELGQALTQLGADLLTRAAELEHVIIDAPP